MGLEYHFNYMVDGNVLLPLTDLEKRVCEVAVCDRCFDKFLKITAPTATAGTSILKTSTRQVGVGKVGG